MSRPLNSIVFTCVSPSLCTSTSLACAGGGGGASLLGADSLWPLPSPALSTLGAAVSALPESGLAPASAFGAACSRCALREGPPLLGASPLCLRAGGASLLVAGAALP